MYKHIAEKQKIYLFVQSKNVLSTSELKVRLTRTFVDPVEINNVRSDTGSAIGMMKTNSRADKGA